MTTETFPVGTKVRKADVPQRYETFAWKWMRYSGVLLIPLVWIHIFLQDILVGVHKIDINYVAARWANMGWRVYDGLLVAFAFAHGMNGVRQVLFDYVHTDSARKIISWVLFILWLVITIIGMTALVGGVRGTPPGA